MPEYIPIDDVRQAAYLELCGAAAKLTLVNGRVIFLFEQSPEINELLIKFSSNVPVPIINYIAIEKKLRGRMLFLRDSGNK